MSFISMKTLIDKAAGQGFAVPAFCIWNAETIQVVLETAQSLQAPVILMSGPGEFPLLKPAFLAGIGRELKNHYDVPAAFHLDHGNSLAMVKDCLDAGYTSVMLDFSMEHYEKNYTSMQEVVRLARPLGVTVEGEIGTIGREDSSSVEGNNLSVFTDPAEAEKFVKGTGIDIVAVSIGNVHGNYRGEPKLNFSLLEEIRSRVNIPIALHGGTGIPEKDIRKGISLGIAKVNVATDLIQTTRNSLMDQWNDKRNLWVPAAFAAAVSGLKQVVAKWINITGAAGRAGLYR